MQEAVALARELLHSFSLAWALSNTAFHYQLRREEKLTQEWAETTITFSSEQGFPYWVARGKISQGWALAEQGQGEKGIIQIHQGLAVWQITGTELWRSSLYALLAEADGRIGRPAEGLAALADAFAAMEKSKAFMGEAELYFLKGELTLQQQFKVTDPRSLTPDPQGEAEACFLKAVEIAQKQQAKSLELRATMSLARLWQQQDKQHEARTMLADIYGWFTEGFDTKDLQEANALLTELALRVS
jgi:predicted ATPase